MNSTRTCNIASRFRISGVLGDVEVKVYDNFMTVHDNEHLYVLEKYFFLRNTQSISICLI